MTRRTPVKSSDLRGAVRLAADATAGLTDLVEAMHERIARVPGFGKPSPDGRTGGITGLVYKSVRGVTRVVGGSVDGLLGLLAPALSADAPGNGSGNGSGKGAGAGPGDETSAKPNSEPNSEPNAEPNSEREAIVAALNGVLGDHLAATHNPLAVTMALRREGHALTLNAAALDAALPSASDSVVVLVHGLCMSDVQWLRKGHDHGAALARDLGFTAVYLHYNSGLHISVNGRELAQQLERLVEQWPRPVKRLVLLCHSMGGLLARSALHHGAQAGQRWPDLLGELVFLGTPHRGAPLERAGHWVDILLGATPYAAPFARLGKLRSAGITDLRHGNLVDEDWLVDGGAAGGAQPRSRAQPPKPQHISLPASVRCFAAAASIGQRSGDVKDRLLGDGLVPLDSALGRHDDPARALNFPPERQWVGYGMNHMELLHRAEVYARLRQWLG